VLSKDLPVECGINRVLIRSTQKTGKIKLTATAEGLSPAEIELKTIPFETSNGTSLYISGEHQPVNLARGETPQSESFTVSRESVEIVAATAGTNEKDVRHAFDDNELSEWQNI
jgi:hypothetical protein